MPTQSMTLPNFFILGTAKSGTTALHDYLGQHPDVFVTPHKEVPFFSLEYDRGLEYYSNTYFGEWRGEAAAGESGGKMMPFAAVQAERLASAVPEARLIALLREPVDRAFSHWWMNVSRGREELGFAEAIDRNLRDLEAGVTFETLADEARWREHVAQLHRGRTERRIYATFGHYARQLRPYLERFPREQLLVLSFDELRADADAATRRVFSFLGVDPDALRLDAAPRNVARPVRATRALGPLSVLSRATGVSRLLPAGLKDTLRKTLFEKKARVPAPDPATAARLREHFAPHNAELVELLGADAPDWARRAP